MPVELRLSKRFQRSLNGLSEADYSRVETALRLLQRQWGAPHEHTGLAIRRLHAGFFECRAGLDLRLVFRATHDGLELVLVGDHDDIRRLLKNE